MISPVRHFTLTEEARTARSPTFAGVIARHAMDRPHEIALADDAREIDYAELAEVTGRIAGGLWSAGVRPGRSVAVISENRIEYALLLLACASIGIPVATINHRQPARAVRRALHRLAPTAIVASAHCGPLIRAAAGASSARGGPRIIDLDGSLGPDAISWGDLAGSACVPPKRSVSGEEIVTIMHTSGSSGEPKAVAISHAAMIARALLISTELGLDGTDAFLGWAPMFHIASTDYLFVTCFLGGTYVVMPRWDPAAVAARLRQFDVGWLMLMPGLIPELLDAVGDAPLRAVKRVGTMPDMVPPQHLLDLTGRLGATYLNTFGSTEAGLAPSACLVDTTGGVVRLEKVPTRFCQVRLVDEHGADVARGEVGEMLLRAPTLFSGYWGDPAATEEAFRGGWYHSGDLMRAGPGGTLSFVDRAKYMIKTGGENVYPSMIERVLLSHPAIVEAVVVRHPHPRLGQAVRAVVCSQDPAPPVAELIQYAAERLARYELPRWIEFVEPGTLPRNVTGKVERAVVEGWPLTAPESAPVSRVHA